MSESELIEQAAENAIKVSRKRKMLPWWVIGCVWLFLVFSALMPVAVILGILHYNFQLSLLGFATNEPLSATGLCLMLVFIFKGITAYGLWTEKNWAVRLAQIDAIASIVICCLAMIYSMIGPAHSFNLRLEFIVIIPYYLKMKNIRYDWEH